MVMVLREMTASVNQFSAGNLTQGFPMVVPQAQGMLGRGVCLHASDHCALCLSILKVMQLQKNSPPWLGRRAPAAAGSAWPGPHTACFHRGLARSAFIFYSCRQVTATHASSL